MDSMHQKLIQSVKQIAPIDSDEEDIFMNVFSLKVIKRGDFFLKEGEVNNKLGFVVEGLVRYFVYKDNEESTLEFSKEGEFIAEYQSFLTQTESIQCIQAIENTTLLVTDFQGLQTIYSKIKNGNLIGRIVIEYRFGHLMRQLLSIYMHTTEERYLHFLKTFPDLVQRVPQYYIASYVGVKPESLSRIRKRLAN
ncbi:MAG: Crp/Fnr family transcriptional regulator [Cyclobacteriaceae bacterium]|nr:Crp/Fnr family transcriptional regulator [Cyclobacteriaceae bacterium]